MELSLTHRSPRRTRFGRKLPLACTLVIGLLGGCPPMPSDSQGAVGPQGPPGSAGADGQLRIFGNGSAGDRTVAASTTLADTNLQYANFTINADVTLTIPSGSVIRCTGTFTNNGNIVVQSGAAGSRQAIEENGTDLLDGGYIPSEAGVALSSSGPGDFGFGTSPRSGGRGGLGLPAFEARSELNPGPKAGGGGGGTFGFTGHSGGGSLTVLAQSAILNAATGTITAAGAGGGTRSGGGGGGVIILTSPGSVVNNGTVSANGGAGGNSDSFAGASGGGGGGIIHMLSPTITAGTTSVTGGLAGANGGAGSVSINPRQGGGGGGACGGDGGRGSSVSIAGTPSGADAGSAGHVLQSTVNPTALF